MQPPVDLVVSSYDSEAELKAMYDPAMTRTLKDLAKNKAQVHFGVDVQKLTGEELRERLDPERTGFDRIVWNFPHAGFPDEQKNEERGPGFEWGDDYTCKHSALLEVFFAGAKSWLREGGLIIVTHKTIEPFSLWDVPGLAAKNGFALKQSIKFDLDHYPGYFNRKGAG